MGVTVPLSKVYPGQDHDISKRFLTDLATLAMGKAIIDRIVDTSGLYKKMLIPAQNELYDILYWWDKNSYYLESEMNKVGNIIGSFKYHGELWEMEVDFQISFLLKLLEDFRNKKVVRKGRVRESFVYNNKKRSRILKVIRMLGDAAELSLVGQTDEQLELAYEFAVAWVAHADPHMLKMEE